MERKRPKPTPCKKPAAEAAKRAALPKPGSPRLREPAAASPPLPQAQGARPLPAGAAPVPGKQIRCNCLCASVLCEFPKSRALSQCSKARCERQRLALPGFKHFCLCETCWNNEFATAPEDFQEVLNAQRK